MLLYCWRCNETKPNHRRREKHDSTSHRGDYFGVRGDCRLDIAPNVTVWSGLDQQFADTIADLQKAHKLYFLPAPLMAHAGVTSCNQLHTDLDGFH